MSRRRQDIFRHRRGLVTIVAGLALLIAAASAIAAGTTLTTEKVRPGKVVASSGRRAVYMFTRDSRTRSACTGSCARTWPALRANGRVTVARGSGLNPRLLGNIRGTGGHPQVTYNHHPLYLFSGDRRPGEVKGEGAHAFGGHWYLVSPAGNPVKPKSRGGCPPGFVPSSTGCVAGGY